MKLKLFREFKQNDSVLFIVDVQKSFRKFFSEMYLHELKKYCQNFEQVYQIWDNHVDGKNVDSDYLYDLNNDVIDHRDLYEFPNQSDLIEKRYNYDVDVDFYREILDQETYSKIKEMESSKKIKRGDYYPTKKGTILVYIGNNHRWFHCPKKLLNIISINKDNEIILVGGSDSECFLDIETTLISLGCDVKRDFKYIYSASHCPIK